MELDKIFTLILEGGEVAGKLELVKISLDKAREFAEKEFAKQGKELKEEMPEFNKRFKIAQTKAGKGKTLRKDMPVIEEKDIKLFQTALSEGHIDLNKPYAKTTNKKDPFPEGLSMKKAQEWLKNGLKDGSISDDKIEVDMKKIKVEELKPIQKQIYFDKAMKATAKFGIEGTTKFLKNTFFVASFDKYIIDGHHRFLSGLLVDPKMEVQVLTIDLSSKKLVELSKAFGDAIGNKRNQ